MKVNSPGSVRAGSVRRKDKSSKGSAGDFASHISASGGGASAAVTGTASLSSVESLVALQEVPGPAEGARSPDYLRAEDLLNRLDRIRLGILDGRLQRTELESLVNRLGDKRRESGDPRLIAVIDEIELRAKVELAKLSVL